MTALICLPVNVLVIQLFRKTRRANDKALIRTRPAFKRRKTTQENPIQSDPPESILTPRDVNLAPYEEYFEGVGNYEIFHESRYDKYVNGIILQHFNLLLGVYRSLTYITVCYGWNIV